MPKRTKVSGCAAVATVAGQILTAGLAVWYLFHMKAVKLGRKSFRPHFKLMARYIPLGVCSFLAQISLVAAMAAVTAIKKLSADVEIPSGIKALGDMFGKNVSMDDIPTMVANAQKDACGLTNPRKMSDAAVAAIYRAAW